MSIKTASVLGFDTLDSQYLHQPRLSRKVIALTAFGLDLSEGVVELMTEGSKERPFLEKLLQSDELRHAGSQLNTESLTQILTHLIHETEPGLPSEANLSSLCRTLNVELCLQVKIEDSPESGTRFAIIATEDEVNMDRGAIMLSRHIESQSLVRGPAAYFTTQEGQITLREIEKRKMTEVAEMLYDLPMILDPAEFEKRVRALSPIMRVNEGTNDKFVQNILMNFGERPACSRRVIAEVGKRHGLNPTLLENIEFLCSDRQEDLQVEAINVVVYYLNRVSNPLETMLAAISLIKILEDDSKPTVRVHALQRLAEKAELILSRLPSFLEKGRVIHVLKNVFVTDPTRYRDTVERLILHFGFFNNQYVCAEVREGLEFISHPRVQAVYFNILESLSGDEEEKRRIATQRWHLYFELSRTNDPLAADIITQFKQQHTTAIDYLFQYMEKAPADEQIFFIGLLDDLFFEYIHLSESDTCKKIAAQILRQLKRFSITTDVTLAILRTKIIFCSKLNGAYQRYFWPAMSEHLKTLLADAAFKQRFIESGHLHFVDFVSLIKIRNSPTEKLTWITIASDKAKAFQTEHKEFEAQRSVIVAAINDLLESTFTLLGETDKVIVMQKFSPAVLINLALSPVIDEKMMRRVFTEAQMLAAVNDWFAPMAMDITVALAGHPLMNTATATNMLRIFEEAVKKNEPAQSKSSGFFEPPSEVVEIALSGLQVLFNSRFLEETQRRSVMVHLNKIIDNRPTMKTVRTSPGEVQTDIPDPYKDLLIDFTGKNHHWL